MKTQPHVGVIDIMSRFARALKETQDLIEEQISESHIDYYGARILLAILEGAVSPGMLQQSARLDGHFSNLAYRVDKLAGLGYLERRKNSSDRRGKRLQLTETGKLIANRVAPMMARIEELLGTFFARDEFDQLLEQIDTVDLSAPAPKLHVVGSSKR